MSEQKPADETDGNASTSVKTSQVIPGYDKFDEFIKVSRWFRLCTKKSYKQGLTIFKNNYQ